MSHLLQLVDRLLASLRLLLWLVVVVEHRPLQVLDPQPIIDRPLDLDVGLAEDLIIQEEGGRRASGTAVDGWLVEESEELVGAETQVAFPRYVHAGDVGALVDDLKQRWLLPQVLPHGREQVQHEAYAVFVLLFDDLVHQHRRVAPADAFSETNDSDEA